MVLLSHHYNFSGVVDGFFALKTLRGTHAVPLQKQVHERAQILLANPDTRYMPAFKILDLLAWMVNIASDVAAEPQMRAHEAAALLRANLADTVPPIRQFVLDAALERARYEPMMILAEPDAVSHRDLALQKRWQAMLVAYQSLEPLPWDWEQSISDAVATVIGAKSFYTFRQGPLMQLFAEMLQTAQHLQQQGASLSQLEQALGAASPLWKRYALKAARYNEKPLQPPMTHGAEARIPDPVGSPQFH